MLTASEHGADGCEPARNEQSIEVEKRPSIEEQRALHRQRMEEAETTSIAHDPDVADDLLIPRISGNFIFNLPGGLHREMLEGLLSDPYFKDDPIRQEDVKILEDIDAACVEYGLDLHEIKQLNLDWKNAKGEAEKLRIRAIIEDMIAPVYFILRSQNRTKEELGGE